ncbi:MAG: adenosylcobalamin-dependent ribonucleoside-diphosphate reductase [Hyphomicrobiaceae bacterium]
MSQSTDSPVLPLPPRSLQIWDSKYRLKKPDGEPVDRTLEDTWRRVARAAASVEAQRHAQHWEDAFFSAMRDFTFLPAGRIIAGAGTGRHVTLFNCFVMGRIDDDLTSIFDNVKEAALTMQRGGGIGHDFSTLRPMGMLVRSVGAGASGPVSFMDVWDEMCRTIMSAGNRRGAMMGTLRCDHPDILTFIEAKRDPQRLRNFNLSILVTDAFMAAVRDGRAWDLQFEGVVFGSVDARELWERIMRATYDYAEPGVIFIDRINAMNNVAYCETISATNPCGEQPLPPYGACLLGSINLARLVKRPFSEEAELDEARLAELVPLAVRFLDNIIDVSAYPLEAQRREAHSKRRIGLGLTGLGDALAMVGARYGSEEAQCLAERWMATIECHAYLASVDLAAEKGACPCFEREPFLAAPNVQRLDGDVRAAIGRHGIRNSCLTSIAPTGTISLLAGNVSSGIEPIFDLSFERRVMGGNGVKTTELVKDHAYRLFRYLKGNDARPPEHMVTVRDLDLDAHLAMQAAVQRHVDSSISKTINCAEDISFDAFRDVYAKAFALGLKGCTTYRPNPITGSVLSSAPVTGEKDAKAGAVPAERALPLLADRDESEKDGSCGPVASGDDGAPGHVGGHGAGRTIGADQEGRAMGVPPADGVAVSAPGAKGPAVSAAGVVYMARPLEREPVLGGFTYKLKWGASDHAIYVTINDIERDGRRRPFEIFINTKNLEHYAWTVALTRMISAVFRRGGDVSFVVEELKAIFDPQGGQWVNGRYVPSLLAAIGNVIEEHLLAIGFLQSPLDDDGNAHEAPAGVDVAASAGRSAVGMYEGRRCPKCGVGNLVFDAGCFVCRDCGYSRCG